MVDVVMSAFQSEKVNGFLVNIVKRFLSTKPDARALILTFIALSEGLDSFE
jgi:hypothetical protein